MPDFICVLVLCLKLVRALLKPTILMPESERRRLQEGMPLLCLRR